MPLTKDESNKLRMFEEDKTDALIALTRAQDKADKACVKFADFVTGLESSAPQAVKGNQK